MNDFKSLMFLDRCRFIFKLLGIEYDVMRRILQLKLTMDQRRVPTILKANSAKKKEGNQFLKSLGIYVLYGIIIIPFIFIGDNYMLQMSLIFGVIMFFLMTSMIADFSSVLLDVRDKNILGTKPVSKKTISAAKMVHISIYMTFLTGALVAIPFIVMVVSKGIIFSLLFVAVLILNVLFIIALTALIYIFTLQFFSGERLKDIINYVQILLSVGIFVGYQLLGRSFEIIDVAVTYTFSWWHIFIPPIWFGAPFELLLHQNKTTELLLLSIAAVLIPIISIVVYYGLMPSFERNLEKLLADSGKSKKKTPWFNDYLARFVSINREERIFFELSAVMMKKEREFKLKVYPSLGFALIFPFIFLFNNLNTGTSLAEIGTGKMYLTIYFSSIMIPMTVHMLKFSENYKGSWLFRAAPIADLGVMHRGAVKAFLVKLYLPIFIVLSTVFIWIFSARILPDLLAVLLAGILHTLISYKFLNGDSLPFTQSFEFAQNMNTGVSILLTLIAGVFAVVHLLALNFSYGVVVYLVVLLIATIVSWMKIFPNARIL
ncbi:hypothetical protein VBD025_04910 [Virgibacillus flavescens]|uniref:hypothetical protein n=1 Tax=Virgibacillus flavescens TaxID=1611422 RepID=UPI003D3402F8